MDLIFMLIVAEAAAHSLGDYTAIADGLVVILTILSLNYLLNELSFHFRSPERLVSHGPIEIVRNGKTVKANMRREFLTDDELQSSSGRTGSMT